MQLWVGKNFSGVRHLMQLRNHLWWVGLAVRMWSQFKLQHNGNQPLAMMARRSQAALRHKLD